MAGIVRSANPDVVFHLAALYLREHEPQDVSPLVESNITFGVQLLEALSQVEPRRLVNTSSQFQHYDDEGYRPLNLYAATKQAFEDIADYYADAAGVTVATLVLSDVYGPDDPRPRLLSAVRQAQQTGQPLSLPDEDIAMDLVFVDDAVDAFLTAARRLTSQAVRKHERFAVRSSRLQSIADVLEAFDNVAGVPVPHEWGKYATPARRIRRPWAGPVLPGWQPKVELREGIERLIRAETTR
jgi:nucleoside-diphosphate-sugar epimerase